MARASRMVLARRPAVAGAAVAAVLSAAMAAAAAPAGGVPAGGAPPPPGGPAATAAAPPGGAPTPLLSVRRVPAAIADQLAATRVGASLAAILTPAALGSAQSCLVVEQGGRILTERNATQPLIPASNMKVLTAAAALDKLGAGYRYTTTVHADHPPAGGIVTGNLYLVGGGDPVLRTPQYEATIRNSVPPYTSLPDLAASVRAAGITEVTGTVVGDESRYDVERRIPTWKAVYTEEGDAGPLSALEVDDGFQSTPKGFAADAQPAQSAARVFAALLTAAGVKVDGLAGATAGVAPAGTPQVAAIQSAPLGQLLAAVLTPSDDTAAELVTKELGVVAGAGGTTAKGTAVISADLAAAGLPVAGLTAVDGSGLDRGDRASCGLLAATLARAGATGPLATELPVAGRTGTLTLRMRNTPAAGRVLAKTGTLDDVSALSGFVVPSTSSPAPTLQLRTPVVFSLIMDGVPVTTGINLGNAVATALAGYPVVPALASLGPQP